MSIKIERGLFKFDSIDYHAVLCVPVDADIKEIRKRYLNIARRLHPDSCASASTEEKQLASELLSKLVNPAYEKLSQERTRTEYMVVLSQMSKRLVQESASVDLSSDPARQLAGSPNVEQLYRTMILKIAETQYDSLTKAVQIIGYVSELNLVYLMRTAGKKFDKAPPPPPPSSKVTSNSSENTDATILQSAVNKEDTSINNYLRRAQELMTKNQFAQARVELQDAIKLAPNNSRCHSLIGVVYLKQNQTTMAKVHFDRALQLDPKDQMASEGKRKIEQLMGQKSGTAVKTAPTQASKQPEKSGGGLFGGLFGGKKK
ncbi:MAG: J domain-containing protein [Calothrix sp. FI2-JRJ7]|jgi:curved DNA-binding protein CbpA|nr:J domain-containing protein [Calothrix sp. FI2-JRJ7]